MKKILLIYSCYMFLNIPYFVNPSFEQFSFEYDRTMNERGWYNEKKLAEDIGTMSKKEAGTCLTAIFRGERFCAGLINEYVKNGIIVEILKHLSETH